MTPSIHLWWWFPTIGGFRQAKQPWTKHGEAVRHCHSFLSFIDALNRQLRTISAGTLPRNPVANVGGTLTELNTVRLTDCEEAHRVPVDEFHFFEIQDNPLCAAFYLCLQLVQVFRLKPATQP